MGRARLLVLMLFHRFRGETLLFSGEKVEGIVSNLSAYSDLERLKHAMIMQCIIGFHVAPCPKTPAWQQHVQQLTSNFSSAIETTGAVGTFCSKDFRNSLHSALFWGM